MQTYYSIFEKRDSLKPDSVPHWSKKHSSGLYCGLFPTEQSAQSILDEMELTATNPSIQTADYYISEVIDYAN